MQWKRSATKVDEKRQNRSEPSILRCTKIQISYYEELTGYLKPSTLHAAAVMSRPVFVLASLVVVASRYDFLWFSVSCTACVPLRHRDRLFVCLAEVWSG